MKFPSCSGFIYGNSDGITLIYLWGQPHGLASKNWDLLPMSQGNSHWGG